MPPRRHFEPPSTTQQWKYIHWYYAGDGMRPTEELFHLGQDPYEMKNLASDPAYADELAAMRQFYDAELAAIETKVVKGHGFEPYPTLFSRKISWQQKEPLLAATKTQAEVGRQGGGAKKGNKRKETNQ